MEGFEDSESQDHERGIWALGVGKLLPKKSGAT
jgi:hypothetical protein